MLSQVTGKSQQASTLDPDSQKCTFQPDISDVSKVLANNNSMFRGNFKDFQTRQDEFIKKQAEKREELRCLYSEEETHSFKP